MTARPLVSLYAITLILSAFLLFSIQPLFARMILPLLGGTPGVWNTAMVFFQAMLLAGYAYAHGTSRFLGLRAQAVLHLGLLAGFAALLPVVLPPGLVPPVSGNPALWQLGVMAMVVGAPFFVISASAPLIQRWFSGTSHKDAANPYFLYAASNIGSMAALLSYPVLVEPAMTLPMQSSAWAWGYGGLILLTGLCAAAAWNGKIPSAPAGTHDARPQTRTKLAWMALAFIPSSLMLGVTTFITTDMASVPLLWIVPLALYLATFIIVFARKPLISTAMTVQLFTVAMIALIAMISVGIFEKHAALFVMHLAAFFFACLLCHKKLADMRPHASALTGFYMYMSAGGVLGGMFNALLAPVVFIIPFEYALMLCAALVVRAMTVGTAAQLFSLPQWKTLLESPALWTGAGALMMIVLAWEQNIKAWYIAAAFAVTYALIALRRAPQAFTVFGAIVLLAYSPLVTYWKTGLTLLERNFFGVLRVVDHTQGARSFMHGTTLHGAQPTDPKYRLTPMTYYNPAGPVGDIFRALDAQDGPQTVGVLGLGVGTLACYARPNRHFDFYEIDPAVVRIAEDKTMFTYLSDCGSSYRTILGDGRLTLAQVPDGTYDVLFLDAFSSDNIPMHLLTLEAFQTYMQKVKAGGMIVFNISNRFLNIEYQLAEISMKTRVPAVLKYSGSGKIAKDSGLTYAAATYVVFTPDPDTLMRLRAGNAWEPVRIKPGNRIWTDDYANILSALMILD